MQLAIVLLAVVNVVIWGYIAVRPDHPEIAERDPVTQWLQDRRFRPRQRRSRA